MPKRPRTPQEKKQLSLTRDRRNLYGENSKASRNSIPKRKAKKRRAQRQILKQTQTGDEVDQTRALARARLKAVSWKKDPDRPLAEKIRLQKAWRKRRGDQR